jgi:predicted Zn-dependent protease
LVHAWWKNCFLHRHLDQLQLNDDEVAMIMGHEMAHALREHSRERLAKSKATGMGLSVASQLLGLGQMGDVAANLGTQLLTLKYGRDDETEADLVGLEIAARGGFNLKPVCSFGRKCWVPRAAAKVSRVFCPHTPVATIAFKNLKPTCPKLRSFTSKR